MRIKPIAVMTCCAAVLTMPFGSVVSDVYASESVENSFTQTAQQAVSFADAWQAVVVNNDGLAAERAKVDRARHLQDAASDLYFPANLGNSKIHSLGQAS